MSTTFTENFEVLVNYDGWRLDHYLTEQLRRASRAKVTRIIKAGVRVERDGEPQRIKPGLRLRTGDRVLIERSERMDPATPPLDEVQVLHEAADRVLINKPPGMLVHRTAYEVSRTVEAFLEARYPGERVEPVHRLDRDTSGVLLCGRGLDAIRSWVARFELAEPKKTYRALVQDPRLLWQDGASRRFDTPLGFDPGSEVQIRVGAGDWECATNARFVRRVTAEIAELELEIERGRQHQIRAHLSLFGTPVVGDKLYGMGDAFFQAWVVDPGVPELVAELPTRWHCLHAWRLRLEEEDRVETWEAPLPAHWL